MYFSEVIIFSKQHQKSFHLSTQRSTLFFNCCIKFCSLGCISYLLLCNKLLPNLAHFSWLCQVLVATQRFSPVVVLQPHLPPTTDHNGSSETDLRASTSTARAQTFPQRGCDTHRAEWKPCPMPSAHLLPRGWLMACTRCGKGQQAFTRKTALAPKYIRPTQATPYKVANGDHSRQLFFLNSRTGRNMSNMRIRETTPT